MRPPRPLRPRHAPLALVLAPALALAAPALAGCGDGESPRREFASDVEHCRANLRALYRGLVAMDAEGNEPTESGVRLFAELVASGHWQDTPENRLLLTCPGANVPGGVPPSFADLDALDGDASAYAGRDQEAHPLPAFPTRGTEPVVACDNARGTNHDGVTNVLYADGSVKTFDLAQELERGTLPAGATSIPVGPDSPLPDLRVFTQR